jgi:hypothetical protein
MPVRQADRINASQLGGRVIEREGHQAAGADIVRDNKGRLVDQALSRDRRGPERIAIIGAGLWCLMRPLRRRSNRHDLAN